jgi:uncharacterized protein YgiM (DUF1202 family)
LNKSRRNFYVLMVLLLFFTACNLPTTQPLGENLNDQAATIVAQTLTPHDNSSKQATPGGLATPGEGATPLDNPTAAQTATPSATLTATATITPTYSKPVIKITGNTNCRTGPNSQFEVVIVLKAGTTVDILGQLSGTNYWIVKTPDGSKACWIAGDYASPSGSIQLVPTVTQPPAPSPVPPAAPRNLTYSFYCTYATATTYSVTTTLNWEDRADNELGYRVLRYGNSVANLPPNSTTYTETITVNAGDSLTYAVQVYNDSGSSNSTSYTFSCQ